MTGIPAAKHRRPCTDLVRVPLIIRVLAQADDGHLHHCFSSDWWAYSVHATPAEFETIAYRLVVDRLVDFCAAEDCVLYPRRLGHFSVVPSITGRALMGRYLHR